MSSMNIFKRTYRKLNGYAHTNPEYFYAFTFAAIGPVMCFTVPPIRRKLGYLKAEPLPTSYPVPNRARRAVSGYEDEP